MKGHAELVAMRRAGISPRYVWLETEPDATECWADWHEVDGNASVQIEPKDNPARLDLRFVVGLTVIVSGTDAERVADVGRACEHAEAKRVITYVTAGVRNDVQRITDTQGDMAWPA